MSFLGLLGKNERTADNDMACKLDAIDRSQAVIEFDLEGNILTANQNFLAAMGYQLDEIAGRHHRMFVDPAEANSPAYAQFWQDLRHGKFISSQYRRFGKANKEIWIQATYDPIKDVDGHVIKVVEFATDITEYRRAMADAESKLNAISNTQAVIEFTVAGEILTANDNFLSAMGYSLEEVRGRHHRMFVQPAYASSRPYQDFWQALGRGEAQSAEFRRFGKGHKEVWIQASYNPVLDANGHIVKVVKFATDITARKQAVNLLGTSLEQLAGGDLRSTIDTAFPDDLEKVRGAFNRSLEQFRNLVTQIQSATSEVESAASEIASGTTDLSARTEQAASDIKVLIQDSNGQVKNGVLLVNQAGEGLGEILGSIGKVAEIVNEISNASQEQALGIQEINTSVSSMDEMTQQNSALVEESIAAARALNDQASKLTELMSFFNLGRDHALQGSGSKGRATSGRAHAISPPSPANAKTLAANDGWDEF